MSTRTVIGVLLPDRVNQSPDFQAIISQYGCNIKTRIGLHDTDDAHCAPNGLILLEMIGDQAVIEEMELAIKQLHGVAIQKMVFEV